MYTGSTYVTSMLQAYSKLTTVVCVFVYVDTVYGLIFPGKVPLVNIVNTLCMKLTPFQISHHV